jgi:hypothetical protein
MNQQGATRAGIVSGLCAGCTVNDTMETSIRTQFTMIHGCLNNLLLLEDLVIGEVYESKIVTARQKVLHTMHRHPCRQHQEDAGSAQEEPHRGVGEGDLTSQLR